jgi:hypothetical protein
MAFRSASSPVETELAVAGGKGSRGAAPCQRPRILSLQLPSGHLHDRTRRHVMPAMTAVASSQPAMVLAHAIH